MDIDIKNKFENKLLKRTEVDFVIKFDKVIPNRANIRLKLSSMINANKDLLVIQKVLTKTGTLEAVGKAHVYTSKDQLSKIEKKYLLDRHTKSEPKKKEEKKADDTEKGKDDEKK